jgi:hypothetical protein
MLRYRWQWRSNLSFGIARAPSNGPTAVSTIGSLPPIPTHSDLPRVLVKRLSKGARPTVRRVSPIPQRLTFGAGQERHTAERRAA